VLWRSIVLAFSIWDALWVVFVSFLFISVLMFMFQVIVDLFRDRDLSGWGKAAWIILIVLFPLIGLLIYVIVRGPGMAERSVAAQVEAKESFDAYVRDAAGGTASELEKAAALHSAGKISDEEYAELKRKILG
jgi:hypothetical protein